ncbi:MAG: hypothetical protein H0U53_07385 [Actinobacteria bacterium]|nr:hypothetical protein [Actinomycetota bacterium]
MIKRALDVLRRIEEGNQEDEPGVSSTGRGSGAWPIRERFSEADLQELVASFRRGATVKVLAANTRSASAR